MVTLAEACRDALLYATATSATLENASRQFGAIGLPAFSHNFMGYSEMLRQATLDLFLGVMKNRWTPYHLPGTNVPSSLRQLSYLDYRQLMLGNPETAPRPHPMQTLQTCTEYASRVFQSAMDASILAVKQRNKPLMKAVVPKDKLLHTSALVWLWLDDAIGGVMRQTIVIPDKPWAAEGVMNLAAMTPMGDSPMMQHLVPEFVFTRFEADAGMPMSTEVDIPMLGTGRTVPCDSQEAADFIERVVNDWHARLCRASGIA